LIHADAVAAPLPESHLLIYMFNPFQGPVVKLLLERLQRLAVEGSRFIDLGYARPEHADVFDGIANVRLLYAGEAVYTAEDTEADFFKTQVTDYRIYRIFADPRLAGEAKP
jgi:hypothetical protein